MLLSSLVAADSVRRLSVAIVLLSNSFNKTLTTVEVERVHEEVAEFYAFYQQHGAGKVDFDFSLIQIDRRLARREIAEVSPGRYYLSRENLESELTARGFRGRFDEVIALHAWSNANPERALQAYGGGAVGPDGKFLGDAGFNSIPVMGRDPNTIGQVLIHEVLHNIDDMFSRSDQPDAFLNADEMSRNMAQLLRERPGAFLPRWNDDEMVAWAERERQGREAYPWAVQLVYYAWMLGRTPREAWEALRYGRMVPVVAPAIRPLYSAIHTSAANDSIYLPVLAPTRTRVTADRRDLALRYFTQADFDGSTIVSGTFYAGWLAVSERRDTSVIAVGDAAGTMVVRQRVASIAAPAEVVQYLEDGPPAVVTPLVLQDRCCGDGPVLDGARLTSRGGPDSPRAAPRTWSVGFQATAPGWYIHPATTRLTIRRSWRITDDGPIVVSLGAPATIIADVREDRGRDDVLVAASLLGRDIPLERIADGRYSATVTEELPFGLHWVGLRATLNDGRAAEDSVRLYVRPAGWIRVGTVFFRESDGRVWANAVVQGRMGDEIRRSRLPLVAIVADQVMPLTWDSAASRYEAFLFTPPEADRVIVTSLVGDFQRRVVPLMDGRNDVTRRPAVVAAPPFAAAIRLDRAPVVDGNLADWPATQAPPVRLGRASHLLTDSATYRGDRDLSATIRFAWDDSTLYVAGEVRDDSLTSGDSWDTERVNLVFDMRDDTSPVTYQTSNPTMDQWQEDDYWVFWRYGGTAVRRYGKANLDPIPGAQLATWRTPTGWAFEVAIPSAALPGYLPFAGQVAGMQLFVTDGDGEPSATELMWTAKWPYTADGIEWRLAELGHLLFTDAVIR